MTDTVTQLAHQLAVLAETDPEADLIVAVRLAVEIADVRRDRHRAVREASLDVAAGWPRDYANTWLPHEEIARRRAEPGPLAASEGAA